MLYRAGFECSPLCATPGKLLFAIAVVDNEGRRLTPSRALLRYLSRFLSFATFYGGYLLAVFNEKKALHDWLSGTQVLKGKQISIQQYSISALIVLLFSIFYPWLVVRVSKVPPGVLLNGILTAPQARQNFLKEVGSQLKEIEQLSEKLEE